MRWKRVKRASRCFAWRLRIARHVELGIEVEKRARTENSEMAGQKGRRRSVISTAPPLLLQRKPYLTGSPPSRRERRCRQECRVSPSIESGKFQSKRNMLRGGRKISGRRGQQRSFDSPPKR